MSTIDSMTMPNEPEISEQLTENNCISPHVAWSYHRSTFLVFLDNYSRFDIVGSA